MVHFEITAEGTRTKLRMHQSHVDKNDDRESQEQSTLALTCRLTTARTHLWCGRSTLVLP